MDRSDGLATFKMEFESYNPPYKRILVFLEDFEYYSDLSTYAAQIYQRSNRAEYIVFEVVRKRRWIVNITLKNSIINIIAVHTFSFT